jgi:hypothetical protein
MKIYTVDDLQFTNVEDYKQYLKEKYNITPEDEAIKEARKQDAEERFITGAFIETIHSKFGDYAKVSLNIDMLKEKYGSHVKFYIKKSKKDEFYSENVYYKKP